MNPPTADTPKRHAGKVLHVADELNVPIGGKLGILARNMHGFFCQMKFFHDFDSGGQMRRRRSTSQLEKPWLTRRRKSLGLSANKPMARAYSAMDYYFDHLKKAIASAPSGGTEFGEKVKACAEQNISSTQEFVRALSYADDIQDMLRIQMEFMRSQMEAFGEQAKDLSEAYVKAASAQTGSRLSHGDV